MTALNQEREAAASIAKGLTKAQREALSNDRGRPRSWNDGVGDINTWKTVGHSLLQLGLIAWSDNPHVDTTNLTPLGLAVREHLKEQPGS